MRLHALVQMRRRFQFNLKVVERERESPKLLEASFEDIDYVNEERKQIEMPSILSKCMSLRFNEVRYRRGAVSNIST